MKKSDFYKIEEQAIHFCKSDRVILASNIKNVAVVIVSIRKGSADTILNATANALGNSIANGNEKVNVVVRVDTEKGNEDLVVNEQILTRGNLIYHEVVEHARNLQKALKKDITTCLAKK